MNIKIIILALLVIAGVTAIALTWNFSEPEPKEMIKEMQTRMAKLNTVHSKTTVNIIGEVDGKEALTITTVHDQDIDNSDKENIRSTGSFETEIELAIEGMEEMSLSLKTENMTIKDTSYIKLSTTPSKEIVELFFRMMGISFSGFLNEWIKFDQDSLDAIIEKDWPPQMDVDSELLRWQQPKIANQFQEFFVSSDLSSIKEVLAEEKINDKTTYHYVLSLEEKDAENLTLIMREHLSEIFPPLKSETDQISGTDIDLWIGKKDKLLYKFELNKKIDTGDGGIITLNIVLEFSDFDQPLNITPPEQFKTLDDLFNKNVTRYESSDSLLDLNSAQKDIKDTRIISYMDQIAATAMMINFEDNSYAGICTDHKIAIPIKTVDDNSPGYASCFAEKDAYCITVELNNGEFYCVDSVLNFYSSPSNSCTADNKSCK